MEQEKQKEEKKPKENKRLVELIANGLPVKDAVFFESIRSTHGGPVFELHCVESYDKKAYKLDHFARMWYTPHCLVVVFNQKGQSGEHLLVPHANIRFVRPC